MNERPAESTEEQIVADIESTRSRMSGTIDEIGHRLNPQVIADQARHQIREATVGRVERAVNDAGYTAQQTGNTIIGTIRENPVPAALAALGIGWLAMRMREQQSGNGKDSRSRRYQDWNDRGPASADTYGRGWYASEPRYGRSGLGDESGEGGQGVGEQARQAAEDITDQARQAADDMRRQAERTWQDVGYQAQGQAAHMQRQFDRTLQENPLALGALAVGVGAAVALAIPETQQEREVLGQHRDRLVSEVERAASGALDEAERSATKALDKTEQRARETGQQMRQEAKQQQS